jgi:hypothetical protein
LRRKEDREFKLPQITFTQTQITKSRKAIEQADTVRRLTILAFYSIPVTSVTGIFGMNMGMEFDLWVFGVTLAAILGTTLLLDFDSQILAIFLRPLTILVRPGHKLGDPQRDGPLWHA